MKYLKSYNESVESKELEQCLYELFDIGFKLDDNGVYQTLKKLDNNLTGCFKLVKRLHDGEDYGFIKGSFTKNEFIRPTGDEVYGEKKIFKKSGIELLDIIEDSVSKLINIYLEDSTYGTYEINHISYRHAIIWLKFYKRS